MAVYYYVSASLPMLTSSDQESPMSEAEMLDVCQRYLSDSDFSHLLESSLDPESPESYGICSVYRQWERSLRNDLVSLRAAEQNLNPEDYSRESVPVMGTSAVATEAMSKNTPLEAELYLDACRWSVIDDLAVGHFFDIEFLQSYKMKLQILDRRSKFDEERGFAAYRDLYARVLAASGTETEIPTGGENG